MYFFAATRAVPPWFRDPPHLLRVGFTDLSLTHTPWRDGYDNGYGAGPYNYTIEYRRNGSAADWSRGSTVRRPLLQTGQCDRSPDTAR